MSLFSFPHPPFHPLCLHLFIYLYHFICHFVFLSSSFNFFLHMSHSPILWMCVNFVFLSHSFCHTLSFFHINMNYNCILLEANLGDSLRIQATWKWSTKYFSSWYQLLSFLFLKLTVIWSHIHFADLVKYFEPWVVVNNSNGDKVVFVLCCIFLFLNNFLYFSVLFHWLFLQTCFIQAKRNS